MLHFMKKDIPILPVHDSFIIIRGLSHELKDVMEKELIKMFNVPVTIDSKPMMVPEGKTPEQIDVNWVMAESDKYGCWNKRNPLR